MQLSLATAMPACFAVTATTLCLATMTPAPPPRGPLILNLDGSFKAERRKEVVLAKVPEGRRLILTEISLVQGRFHGVEAPDLLEVVGKRRTIKLSSEHIVMRGAYDNLALGMSERRFATTTGLVFEPESRVVLRCRSSSGRWHYNVVGYYE